MMFRFETKYMREKKITVGDSYMEVDIIPRNLEDEHHRKGTRSKKQKISVPKQNNLNEKNARRYLVELGNGNFGEGDLHVTLTYKDEYRPKTIEEAEKNVTNYIRRINYRRKRRHLPKLKYILVTEYDQDDQGKFTKKIHHHLIMDGALDRDTVESLWTFQIPGTRKKQSLGFVRTDRLQPDAAETGNGIEGLLQYLSKDPKGKKRWSSSRNLQRPVSRKNDWKYRKSQLLKAKDAPDHGYTFFSKKYPKFNVVAPIEWQFNELTGWHVYLKMWRKTVVERNSKNGRLRAS